MATKLTFTIVSQVAQEMVKQQAKNLIIKRSAVILFLIFSTLFAFYLLVNTSQEEYRKIILARVVSPVKESAYFKEMIENPIKQLESSASGLQHFFD